MNDTNEIHFTMDPEVVNQLGTHYESTTAAAAELVFNGFDATTQKKPVVEIRFYESDDHPVLGNYAGIGIQDNGCGFTAEVLERYGRVGKSARVGHGRHGLGKLAALQLCDLEKGAKKYFIVTRPEKTDETIVYEITAQAVVKGTVEGRPSRDALPYKVKGTFSEILIPFHKPPFTAEELKETLTARLPFHTEWVVRIDGDPVPPRKLPRGNIIKLDSGRIAHYKESVSVHIGKPTVANKTDCIGMADAKTGRTVVDDITTLHRTRRELFPSILLEPGITGVVLVPDLEDWSSTDRNGLDTNFWKSKQCDALMAWLLSDVAPKIETMLGKKTSKQRSAEDVIQNDLEAIERYFGRTFGASSIVGHDNILDGNSPGGGSGGEPRPPRPGYPHPDRRPRPGTGPSRSSPSATERREPILRVENQSYRIRVLTLDDPTVAFTVRSGNMVVLNNAYKLWEHYTTKVNRGVRREWLIGLVMQAHVQNTYDASLGGNPFATYHRIVARLNPNDATLVE